MTWQDPRREEAAEHARKSRFPKAIECYRALLSEEPEDAELRAELADVYLRSKNNERAFHHYNKASAIYLGRGDANNGLRMLIAANAVSPNEPDILYRMAECLAAMGRIQDLDQVLVQLVRAANAPGDRRRVWALDQLYALHPDDFGVATQRAEALGEAGRVDEAVAAYKYLSSRLVHRPDDFVRIVRRAAEIATVERPDLGVDLATVLTACARPRDALMLLVPYYEKLPDDVGVLEALLHALEAMGATEKLVPARIELIKARAKREQKHPTLQELDDLLRVAPDDPQALEVAGHAFTVFKEISRANEVWRHLARICDARSMRLERDRAVLQLLKNNPSDEEALDMGARALLEASRVNEAQALRQRLEQVRAQKRHLSSVAEMRASAPPSASRVGPTGGPERMPIARAPSGLLDHPESTFSLDDGDVLDVRTEPLKPNPRGAKPDPMPEIIPDSLGATEVIAAASPSAPSNKVYGSAGKSEPPRPSAPGNSPPQPHRATNPPVLVPEKRPATRPPRAVTPAIPDLSAVPDLSLHESDQQTTRRYPTLDRPAGLPGPSLVDVKEIATAQYPALARKATAAGPPAPSPDRPSARPSTRSPMPRSATPATPSPPARSPTPTVSAPVPSVSGRAPSLGAPPTVPSTSAVSSPSPPSQPSPPSRSSPPAPLRSTPPSAAPSRSTPPAAAPSRSSLSQAAPSRSSPPQKVPSVAPPHRPPSAPSATPPTAKSGIGAPADPTTPTPAPQSKSTSAPRARSDRSSRSGGRRVLRDATPLPDRTKEKEKNRRPGRRPKKVPTAVSMPPGPSSSSSSRIESSHGLPAGSSELRTSSLIDAEISAEETAPPTLAKVSTREVNEALEDMPIRPPAGPITDPFFQDHGTANHPRQPGSAIDDAFAKEVPSDPPPFDMMFSPEEVTSRMEALVLDEIRVRRASSIQAGGAPPKGRLDASSAKNLPPSDAWNEPMPETQPMMMSPVNLTLVADLLEEGVSEKRERPRPSSSGRKRPKR